MFTSIRTPLLASALLIAGVAAAPAHAGVFPTIVSYSGTGTPNVSAWAGAPDDVHIGLGAGNVTFDFGTNVVVNRPGLVDLNVYEVDTGVVEFNLMTIGVSQDGVTFTSIKASEVALVRTSGDTVHGNNSFGRSYDLGAFDWIRYVLIDGLGSGGASGNSAFDLDAIGAHEVRTAVVPVPGTLALMLAGLAGIAGMARRRLK